jgi:hypothetical protein
VDHPNGQAPGAPVRAGIPEHGHIPKYDAVKAPIGALVDEPGEGAVVPTERDLSERHDVARETVRQAIRELLLEGKPRRQGRGTVGAGPKLEQPLSLHQVQQLVLGDRRGQCDDFLIRVGASVRRGSGAPLHPHVCTQETTAHV